MSKKGLIYIMDMESSLADALSRRIQDMGQYQVFHKWDMEIDATAMVTACKDELKGIIFSGSGKNVNGKKHKPPKIPLELVDTGVPILGICYGMQYIAHLHGKKIVRCWEELNPIRRNRKKDKGEQGPTLLKLTEEGKNSILFRGLGDTFPVWMKHRFMVDELPEGWTKTAGTRRCPIGAMEKNNLFAVQFHPEPYNSLFGRTVLHNFLTYACGVKTPYF